LGLGILAACTACRWDAGDWLGYHVLMLAWTALGFLLVLVVLSLRLLDRVFVPSVRPEVEVF
jgi:hypothetical protein